MRSLCRSLRSAAVLCAVVAAVPASALAQRVGAPQLAPSSEAPPRRELDVRVLPRDSFRLDEGDEIATLDAIRIALSEVADGSTYVWYRDNGHLNGLVTPTSSFKDGKGRVCRHILLILSAGQQTGRVEGIACRGDSGRWLLEG
jgi:surface antigen